MHPLFRDILPPIALGLVLGFAMQESSPIPHRGPAPAPEGTEERSGILPTRTLLHSTDDCSTTDSAPEGSEPGARPQEARPWHRPSALLQARVDRALLGVSRT